MPSGNVALCGLVGGSTARFDLEGVERGEPAVPETPAATPTETESPRPTPSEEPATIDVRADGFGPGAEAGSE